jgi:hypothetical protein
MWLVALIATLAVASGKPVPRGSHSRVRGGNNKGHVKTRHRRQLDPDVNNMDLSLFREHEEGFPGDLFYEDTEGEATLQQMVPQWRQAGKATAGSKKDGFNLKSKKNCKSYKAPKAPSVGKASTKNPSAVKEYCSDAPSMAPAVGTLSLPTSGASPTVGGLPTGGGVTSGASPTSSTGSSSKGSGDVLVDASDANCAAIAADPNLKSGGPSTILLLNKDVDTEFRIKSKNNIDVTALLDKYSKYVRLYVLGCFDEAATELNGIVQRRLITEPLFQATMDDWMGKCLSLGWLLSV